MNFFEKNLKKNKKKISAGLCPAPPNVTPQNLCLQGKLMPLTLRLALDLRRGYEASLSPEPSE